MHTSIIIGRLGDFLFIHLSYYYFYLYINLIPAKASRFHSVKLRQYSQNGTKPMPPRGIELYLNKSTRG